MSAVARQCWTIITGETAILSHLWRECAIKRLFKTVFTQSGKHYEQNPLQGQEGEDDFIEIGAAKARGRSIGTISAEDIRNDYVSSVKEGMKSGELPANIPNLPVQSEQPAAVKPVDFESDPEFIIPENDGDTISKLIKLKSNLFK